MSVFIQNEVKFCFQVKATGACQKKQKNTFAKFEDPNFSAKTKQIKALQEVSRPAQKLQTGCGFC